MSIDPLPERHGHGLIARMIGLSLLWRAGRGSMGLLSLERIPMGAASCSCLPVSEGSSEPSPEPPGRL